MQSSEANLKNGSSRGKRVALITGASGKVGVHIVSLLAGMGFSCILHYRSPHQAKQIQQCCDSISSKFGTSHSSICFDLEDDEALASQLPNIIERHTPSILVNGASDFLPGNFTDNFSLATLHSAVALGIWAPAIASNAMFLAHKKARTSGLIINMLDARIHRYKNPKSIYLLSKQALGSLTKTLSVEYKGLIRVNGICIGSTEPGPSPQSVQSQGLASMQDILSTIGFIVSTQSLNGCLIYLDNGTSNA